MRLFKMLKYTHIDKRVDEDRLTHIEMFVPGVNSGAYDRALVINMRGIAEVETRFKTKKHRVYLSVKLPPSMIEALRDECDQILKLVK